MNEIGEIIINASYRDFFSEHKNFHKEQFLITSLKKYDTFSSNDLIRVLGLSFQKSDSDRQALYGLEIKSNGSSRPSRIPLVRIAEGNQSIWKISSRIEDLQKTVTILDELVYFLEKHNGKRHNTPLKVVVLRDDESYYATQNSPYYKFVYNLVEKSGIILFSLQLIESLLTNGHSVDLNSYLQKTGMVFTTTPNN